MFPLMGALGGSLLCPLCYSPGLWGDPHALPSHRMSWSTVGVAAEQSCRPGSWIPGTLLERTGPWGRSGRLCPGHRLVPPDSQPRTPGHPVPGVRPQGYRAVSGRFTITISISPGMMSTSKNSCRMLKANILKQFNNLVILQRGQGGSL